MAAQTTLEVLLKARNEAEAAFQDFTNQINNIKGDVDKVSDATKGAGEHVQDFGKLAKEAFENPLGAIQAMMGSLGDYGVAASIGVGAAAGLGIALIELGQHATETAAELKRVSLTTGIAVPALTDLKFALDSTGGSLDQLNTVMFMFEQRMVNSSSKVDTGLKMIGLSLDQIEGMSHDQQLFAISDAMRGAAEGTNLAATAMDIFGTQGRTILPELLQPLSELAEKSKAFGGITAAAAEEAHKFEIAHKTMAAETGRAWTELGLAVAPATNQLSLGWERMKLAVANVALTGADLVTGFRDLVNEGLVLVGTTNDADVALRRLGGDLPEVNQSLKGAADGSQLAAKGLDDWRKAVEANTLQMPSAIETEKEFGEEFGTASAQASKLRDELGKHIQAVQTIVDSLEGESKKYDLQKEAINQVIASHTTNIDVIARVVDAIDKLKAQHIAVSKTTLDWADANRTVKGTIDALHGPLTMLSQPIADNTAHMEEMRQKFETARSNIDDLDASVNEFHDGLTIAGDTIATVTIPMFGTLEKGLQGQPDLWDNAEKAVHRFHTEFGSWQTDLDQLSTQLQKLAQVSGGTFGGIVRDIASDVAAFNLTTKSTEQFMDSDSLSGKATAGIGMATGFMQATHSGQGKTAGALSGAASGAEIGSMFGPWGTAVGAGVGALVGLARNTGPSQEELGGRQSEADFEKSFGGFEKMMLAVGAAYDATGRGAQQAQADVKALLDAEKQGPAATQAWIDKINQVFKEQKDVASGVTDIITKSHGLLVIPEYLQASIDKLLTMKGLTDDETRALKGLHDQGPDFAKLEGIASGYGITLEGLGPKFQQAHIDTTANKIYDDFTQLMDAGADVNGVLLGMSKSIQGVVTDAFKFGQAVPENMRPVLQRLVDMGKLTDDQGKKLTDLSGLKFDDSESPLQKGMKTLTDALDHLSSILLGLPANAKTAADGMATELGKFKPPVIPIHFSREDRDGDGPSYAAEGGYVTARGVQYFGGGGNVLPFLPRGTDTVPAMLTPGEVVLNKSQ